MVPVQRLDSADAPEVERYDDVRAAELLLNNAADADDYERVRREVSERFDLDPDDVPHDPPQGVTPADACR
jgi:hypothetical protein